MRTCIKAWMSSKFGQIRPLVSMATDSFIIWKTVLPLFLTVLDGIKIQKFRENMSRITRIMRKPAFNKGSDQLHSYRAADQHLCFRSIDSTIPLFSKSKISSLYPTSVAVQPCMCQETPQDRFSHDATPMISVQQTNWSSKT